VINSYVYFSETGENPYSDMVIADDRYLFLSGLISQDLKTGEVLKGDIVFETKRVLENLETILRLYGSGMDQVIRTEVLLSDFSERDEMNAEYVRHFPEGHLPARLCFGNVGLACDCKVEIAVTACK
jgi:2-iminobutanoate/2-iminopropanoate deaminase